MMIGADEALQVVDVLRDFQQCFFWFAAAGGGAAAGGAVAGGAAAGGAAAGGAVAGGAAAGGAAAGGAAAGGAAAASGAAVAEGAAAGSATAAAEAPAIEGAAAAAETAAVTPAAASGSATPGLSPNTPVAQTPIPPSVQELLKPEPIQTSSVPTVDFGANASTPSGPVNIPRATTPGKNTAAEFAERFPAEGPGLVKRLNEGIEKLANLFGPKKGTDSDGVKLIKNIRELAAKNQPAPVIDQGGSSSPEQATPSSGSPSVPQFARAQITSFGGAQDLGLANFSSERAQSISKLAADLRLSGRRFG